MHVSYFEKLTLLDYPGKLAAVVFTPGCVFRCPYCHNPELISAARDTLDLFRLNREEDFFTFLKSRQGKLDGVCITGGEPTIHAGLIDFISQIKEMGFLVKLDTNGLFPERVQKILESDLVDYWAMDIKHTPQKYNIACGIDVDLEKIRKSISLIMTAAKDYEFRTTVVPGMHEEKDFIIIAEWIKNAKRYYLQEYRPLKIYDASLHHLTKDFSIDLNSIKNILSPKCTFVGIRS